MADVAAELSLVEKRQSRIRNRVCKRCKFSTSDSIEFLHHQISAHAESREEDLQSCDQRDYVSSNHGELASHKRAHRRSSSFPRQSSTDSETGPMDETNNNLDQKANILKDEPKRSGGSGATNAQEFACPDCDDVTTSAKAHYRHRVQTHDEGIEVFECDQCDFAATQQQSLNTHRRRIHSASTNTISSPVPSPPEPISHGNLSNNINGESMSELSSSFDFSNFYRDSMDINQNRARKQTDEHKDMPSLSISKPSDLAGGMRLNVSNPLVSPPSQSQKKTPSSGGAGGKQRPSCAPIREAVDPAKYRTIREPDGIKYACSKCGNIYKWRKSLNKHWKEKHDGEIPDPLPTMTQINIPRFPNKMPVDMGHSSMSRNMAYNVTQNMKSMMERNSGRKVPTLTSHLNSPALSGLEEIYGSTYERRYFESPGKERKYGRHEDREIENQGKMTPFSSMYHDNPKNSHRIQMGGAPRGMKHSPDRTSYKAHHTNNSRSPYSRNQINQPVFSDLVTEYVTERHTNSPPQRQFGEDPLVLDLSKKAGGPAARTPRSKVELLPPQDEPLDFSMKPKSLSTVSSDKEGSSAFQRFIKPEFKQEFNEMTEEEFVQSQLSLDLQCSSCAYIGRNKQDYENHMELHLRKRHHKCAECQQVFFSIEELNRHFLRQHIDLALSKIHGTSPDGTPTKESDQPRAPQLYHYLTTDSKQLLACMVCGAIYQWQWTLAKHFDEDHPSIPNPYSKRNQRPRHSEADGYEPSPKRQRTPDLGLDDALQCTQCTFMTNSSQELTRHQLKHSINQNFICKYCGFVTKWKEEFIHHHNEIHDSLPPIDQIYDEDTDYSQITSFIPPGSNQVIDLTAEDTAVVIPQAPEDTALMDQDPNSGKARGKKIGSSSAEILLPFKCSVCEYRARWPSEITQHMKNHSDEKPYLCPRCSYRSKWKWDVVKHLKRCGGGTVKDVIDTTKQQKQQQVKALLADVLPPSPGGGKSGSMNSGSSGFVPGTGREVLSNGPPNVTVIPTASSTILAEDLEHLDPNELDLSANSNSSYSEDRGLSPTNSSPTPDGSHNSKHMAFKGLVNQGQHYCLQCPFVGNSPAELKRHSRVHSDEKPFICKTCGYSSKWKCDLKKHLKTYNHTSAVPLTYGGHGRKPADWYEKSKEEKMGLDDSYQDSASYTSADQTTTVQGVSYKCNKCPYQTNQKAMLENHMKIHGLSSQGAKGKLMCKQCHYEASDLSSFLQHKLSHNSFPGADFAYNDTGSPPPETEQNETPKHRRKAKQQFRVMPSLESNDYTGDSDYEGNEDRSDDMDINAMEYMEYGDMGDNTKSHMKGAKGNRAPNYQCDICPFSTSNKSNFEKHNRCHSAASRYMCEWCTWSSNTLNRLYHHAQTMHSNELAQQEKDDFRGKVKGRMFSGDEFPPDNAEGEDMTGSIQTKRSSSDSMNDERELIETPPLRPGTSKRRRRLKTCSKCGYVTDNVTTLQRHMAKHGSNGKFTCEQCDYSVDRLHVLQYHIKIVHEAASEKAALSLAEEKRNGKEDEVDNESMDTSEVEGDETVEQTNEGLDNIDEPGETPDFEIVKLRGSTVKLMKSSVGTLYGCLKCPYVNNNITNAVTHTKQHGAQKRYTCEFCDYSLDQLRHVVHHMKTIHHSEGGTNDVSISDEGVDTDSLAMDGPEVVTEEEGESSGEDTDVYAEKEKPEQSSTSLEIGNSLRSQSFRRFRCIECSYFTGIQRNIKRHRIMHRIIGKKLQCDRCPYKATVAETLRLHIRKNHHADTAKSVIAQKISNTCKYCPFATDSLGELKNHLRHHGSGMVYVCDFCDYSIDNLSKLLKHRNVHEDEAEFTPDYQSPRSDIEGDDGSARKTRRQSARMAEDGVDCRECPYQTRSHSLLRSHMGYHGQQAKYVCDFCTFSSPKAKHIQKHRNLHRDQEGFVSYKPKRKLINEEYCQAIYAKRVMCVLPKLQAVQNLIRKYSVAARDSPKGSFLCKSCPFSCYTKQVLAAHNNQHRMSGFYGCDKCSYGANRLEVFCKHACLHLIKSQDPKLPTRKSVRCSKCLYCTRSRKLMKIHLKRHN